VPRVGVTPKFAPVAVAIDESTIGAELNARAQQIRDSLVEARVLTKFGARKTAVGVTQPDVAGAPRIITFSNSTAYEAVQKGRFQLAPGEELGPPPRFDEAGDLMEESHVEFLGAEHATDKYNAKGGWIGTVPQQCPNCATRMSGGTWIHTKPNSGTTVSAAPKEAVGQ
jgi:hypothetical protein